MTQGQVPQQQQLDPRQHKEGVYKGCKCVKEESQWGYSKGKGTPELILAFDVPELQRKISIVLYFGSPENARITSETMRVCGWSGVDPRDLTGIDSKPVDLSLKYEFYDGSSGGNAGMKPRWTILTGGGRITTSKPASDEPGGMDAWFAKVQALTGNFFGAKGNGQTPPPAGPDPWDAPR